MNGFAVFCDVDHDVDDDAVDGLEEDGCVEDAFDDSVRVEPALQCSHEYVAHTECDSNQTDDECIQDDVAARPAVDRTECWFSHCCVEAARHPQTNLTPRPEPEHEESSEKLEMRLPYQHDVEGQVLRQE